MLDFGYWQRQRRRQSGEKPFQFLFTWPMRRKFDNKVTISLGPVAVTPLRAQRKVLPPDDIRRFLHSLFGIHRACSIYEQQFVY